MIQANKCNNCKRIPDTLSFNNEITIGYYIACSNEECKIRPTTKIHSIKKDAIND